MGIFLREASGPPHLGYTDKEFYVAAAISFLAFVVLGAVAILKKSLSLSIVFVVLLSISSLLALLPTIEA
jgi:uncharacterized membrane protein YhaH (DUF805 family)